MSGRIRTIKPELLEDAVSAGLSDTAFRLFIAAILLADDYGCFRAETNFVSGQVYWKVSPSTPLEFAMGELAKVVDFYEVNGQRYGHIRNWDKHQKVSHRGKRRVPAPSEVVGDPPESLVKPSGGSPEILRPDLRSPISDHRPHTSIGKNGNAGAFNPGPVSDKPESKPKGKHRFPETHCPDSDATTTEVKSWCEQWSIPNPHPELPGFLDCHRKKGSRWRDWAAAWRGWLRNADRYRLGPTGPPGTKSAPEVILSPERKSLLEQLTGRKVAS